MKHIFLSGPYSASPEECVRMALIYADTLTDLGLIPFVPHLYHFWDKRHPHAYEFWMVQTMAWIDKCDAVLRTPGFSPGADREVEYARSLNMPVFMNMCEVRNALGK